MASRTRLKTFLDDERVLYHDIPHDVQYTSQETAADTHTPGRKFVKTVVVQIEGRYVLVVLPAHHRLDLEKFRLALGVTEVRLASEEDMRRLFPDAEVGAEPPFGNLYGLRVFASNDLAEDDWVTFNAGTHRDAIRMRYPDFVRLVHPSVLRISVRETPGSSKKPI